jgi:hypothetical protein
MGNFNFREVPSREKQLEGRSKWYRVIRVADPDVFGPPGSGSGSISQRHGSADPDPYQNGIDPKNCSKCGHTEELHDPLVQMEVLQPLEQEGEPLPVVSHQASRAREFKFYLNIFFSTSSNNYYEPEPPFIHVTDSC